MYSKRMVLKKCFKEKQHLYEKLLKIGIKKVRLNTKLGKGIFELIKEHSKKLHFFNFILKYKNNIRKIWEIIKSIGKGKCNHQIFPKEIKVGEENITNEDLIIKQFNIYFT